MSSFIRSNGRLFRKLFDNSPNRIFQQRLKYSQQSSTEPVISRKKKYIYTAFLGLSCIAFGYYVRKEKEYGKLRTINIQQLFQL